MLFQVLQVGTIATPMQGPHCYLTVDNWDDWGAYRTQFFLTVIDENNATHYVGRVKIGQVGLLPNYQVYPGQRAPELAERFSTLDNRFFSVGQDETYYETLDGLSTELKQHILIALRDCAFDVQILDEMRDEPVMARSLLRQLSEENIRHRLNRLAHGNVELTAYQFEYTLPLAFRVGSTVPFPPTTLSFDVQPNSLPPTNIHVLIGRNGVGKTRCMQNLAKALLNVNEAGAHPGYIRLLGANNQAWSFAGLVSVWFSAFDHFDLPESQRQGMTSRSVGLRRPQPGEELLKLTELLANDFCESFAVCRTGRRQERWLTAINTLSTDPQFADADVAAIIDFEGNNWEDQVKHFFGLLSSGHKIVLLTITRLVELVDERTIVLLDEPELHLHPPLLSAFVRALADLLLRRNGVAIVATHSPVVLQEVPKSCIWKLRRSGVQSVVERPAQETFGENVGTLTREVFGLEVTTASFHHLLQNSVDEYGYNFEYILYRFQQQLGSEARAILRGMISNRSDNDQT